MPTYCFLCGVLGHGETNCPMRYDEGFVEPEQGFTYGSWLRVLVDGRENSSSVQRQPRPITQEGNEDSQRAPTRIGAAIFDHGRLHKEMVRFPKNPSPNLGHPTDNQGGLVLSSFSSFSVEKSGTSAAKADRRRVKVQSLKRKAKEVVLADITDVGKRPQLQLRD